MARVFLLVSMTFWLGVSSYTQDTGCKELLGTAGSNAPSLRYRLALCQFEHGAVEEAMKAFSTLRHDQHFGILAVHWQIRCAAALGQDSVALAMLRQVPDGLLQFDLLDVPEITKLTAQWPELQQRILHAKPGWNAWTLCFACIVLIGLCVTVALFFGHMGRSTGAHWLALATLVFSLLISSNLLYWTNYIQRFPQFQDYWQALSYFICPAIYFYVKTVFGEAPDGKHMLQHCSLPLVAAISAFWYHLADSNAWAQTTFQILSSPVLLCSTLVYYSLRVRRLTEHEYQSDQNILSWTLILARGLAAYCFAYLTYFMLVRTPFFSPEWDYLISLVMAAGILAIAYMGLIQKQVFTSTPISRFIPVAKYQSSSLTEAASKSIQHKLERLLNEQQVYKENELRLDDLAAYLSINRHQMSQVINEHYGVNFFDFINRYRVAHVKLLLANPECQNQTIQQLAFESGFNNKASFHRYFKKETGLTPQAYRMKVEAHGV